MKTIMRIICLLLLTTLGTAHCFAVNGANEYNLQTPNAADLGRFGMFPVSYFSGTANVTIPIYSTNQQGVPLDVFLQYDGSGVKPNRLPGWTGTSWTLVAGGVINRVQKGYADEYTGDNGNKNQFYSNITSYFNSNGQILSYLDGIEANPLDFMLKTNTTDLSPDIFYFNFMGISGHFLLGNDGKWKVYCDKNIEVRFDYHDHNNFDVPEFDRDRGYNYQEKCIKGFVLLDEKGNKYTFGATNRTSQHSEPIEYSIPLSRIGNGDVRYWNANSWYLSSVIDRNGDEIYRFEYERGPFMAQITNSLQFAYQSYFADYDDLYLFDFWDLESRVKKNETYNQLKSAEQDYLNEVSHVNFYEYSWSNESFPYSAIISSPVYLKSIEVKNGKKVEFKSESWETTNRSLFPSIYQKYGDSLFKDANYLYPKKTDKNKDYPFSYLQDPYYQDLWSNKSKNIYPGQIKNDPLIRTECLRLLNVNIISKDGKKEKVFHLSYNDNAKNNRGNSRSRISSKRLFLTNVTECCVKNQDEKSQSQYYSLHYNNLESLPTDYLSMAVDRCGIYNGDETEFLELFYKKNSSAEELQNVLNSKYTPDTIKAQYGMLKKIVFPTGGCTYFEYGVNKFDAYMKNGKKEVPKNKIYGGLRIERMCTFLDSLCLQKSEERTFTYEQGESSQGEVIYLTSFSPKTSPGYAHNASTLLVAKHEFNSIIPLSDEYCSTLGYSKVTETIIPKDGNKVVKNIFNYSNLFSNKLINNDLRSLFTSICEGDKKYYSQMDFSRGKLLKKETLCDGHLIHRKENEYRKDSLMFQEYVLETDCHINEIRTVNDVFIFYYNDEQNPGVQIEGKVPLYLNIPTLYYTGDIYKHFYPRFDIVKTTETYYDYENAVTADLTTTYDKVDYGQLRFDRCVTKRWNTAGHTADKQTEDKVEYSYAFDYFVNQNSSTNTKPTTSSSQKPKPNPDPNADLPQWMKDQGMSYYVELPDWVLTIGADGYIYRIKEEIQSVFLPRFEHPEWRYVGSFQIIAESGWSRVMQDSIVQVLCNEKKQWDLAKAQKLDSLRNAREEYALNNYSSGLLEEEIRDLQSQFESSHFYPVVRTETYHNNVKVGVTQTHYKDFSGLIMPRVALSTLGDTVISYTKYLEYNKLGLPTKIQEKGKPYTYLFWDETKLQAITTSGDTTVVPTFEENQILKNSVKYGNRLAYQIPETQTQIARYDANNRISSIVNELGQTEYYDYDGFDRLVGVDDDKYRRRFTYSYHIQDDGYNYVVKNEFLDEKGTDSVQYIQYYDGLGRPYLTANNAENHRKGFIYALTEYDSFGRESKSWAPIVGNTTLNGNMSVNYADKSKSTYNDAYGYTQTEYDALGRIIKTTLPGKDRHTKGKCVITYYGFNKANNVKKYDLAVSTPNQLSFSFYAQGDLQRVTTIDEDGKVSEVYSDSRGLKVLDRRYNGNEKVETYYVYNDFGQLVWVLQPKYQEEEKLSKYAFHYTYNSQGQVVEKMLPGRISYKYWYDEAGRLSKMQDGMLKRSNEYRVYTYDALGRMKTQSLSDGKKIKHDEIVNFYDDYSFLDKYGYMVPENTLNDKDANLNPNYPENGHGHLTGVLQRASDGTFLLMSNTYDAYHNMIISKEIGLDKNLAVVSKIPNFNGTPGVSQEDFYRYDESIGKLNDNSLFAWKKHISCPYNNKKAQTTVIHLQHGPKKSQTCDGVHSYGYDEFGRIVRNDREGSAGDMEYDLDKLNGYVKRIKSTSGFEQNLYRGDEGNHQSWNGSIAAMSWKFGNAPLRRYDYKYDGLNRLTDATFGSYKQKSATSTTMELIPSIGGREEDYSVYYQYDKNSNLLELERHGWAYVDAEGHDIYDTVDDVVIDYNGNQRKSVQSYIENGIDYYGKFSFVDGAQKDVEYTYNANGALINDRNKGILISYDDLGYPQSVYFKDKSMIKYVYAADGRKLREIRVAANRRDKDTVDYVNTYVFKNRKPIMYQFQDGYYSFDKDGKMDGCHLYVKDHQGNVRMVVNAYTDSVEQINHYYPYGALMGDISTNPDMQNYKYSGKELDRRKGMDMYDFHARWYDPILGGFDRVDPLAEKNPQLSLYSYCGGDPINCIDPDGKITIFISGFVILPWQRGDASYWDDSFLKTFNAIDKPSNSNDIFLDGSVGSEYRLDGSMSLNPNYRKWFGEYDGEKLAPQIASSLLTNENGDYIEPIYIVTHSMGAAYAKGFVKMLVAYFESLGGKMPKITEFDFQPHQPEFQKANPMVETWQISHIDDDVVDNNFFFYSSQGIIDGAIQVPQFPFDGTGHSSSSNGNVLDWIRIRWHGEF